MVGVATGAVEVVVAAAVVGEVAWRAEMAVATESHQEEQVGAAAAEAAAVAAVEGAEEDLTVDAKVEALVAAAAVAAVAWVSSHRRRL